MISCVMPTADRAPFVRLALRAFAAQTFPDRELIVVDDGERPVRRLCLDVPGVRYIRLKEYTPTGAKLNIGIEAARGDFIQKIDDDDYYAPRFLASQAGHMPTRGFTRTLVVNCCFLILLRGSGAVHHSGHGWQPGGTLYFHKSMWKRNPFREIRRSSDSSFIADNNPRIVRICDPERYLLVRHGANTWNLVTTGDADEYLSKRPEYGKMLEDLVPPANLRYYRRTLGCR